jgi:hypothetical protein
MNFHKRKKEKFNLWIVLYTMSHKGAPSFEKKNFNYHPITKNKLHCKNHALYDNTEF